MFHVCFNRDVPCPPFSAGDQGQDLIGEHDHDAAGDGHHTVGPLRGVMGLEAEAQLQHAEAQQDDAHGPDQAEDEVAELVHHGDGITASVCCWACTWGASQAHLLQLFW